MSKKIYIDKEDWEKIAQEFNSNDLPKVTEIDTDQSIEEHIKHYPTAVRVNVLQAMTEQDLISKAREKEKFDILCKWINDNSNEINTLDILNKISELRDGDREFVYYEKDPQLKEKTTVLIEGTFYPNDGFWINGVKVFPDAYKIK